jgi:hypothetical protein
MTAITGGVKRLAVPGLVPGPRDANVALAHNEVTAVDAAGDA